MLEIRGVDTEDYKIALAMDLPFLMDQDEVGYYAGSMLQCNKGNSL